jgi:hypothetical protein
MPKKNILVFPCGSEIGLEIYRSIEYSTHFNLIGASSIDDHGKFVYANYIGNLPFYNSPNFIVEICRIVKEYNIEAIYPAMDSVIALLKKKEETLGCKVISSCSETTEICLSKTKTYNILKNYIAVPETYTKIEDIQSYPVFLKPDVGYGSRGVLKAATKQEVIDHKKKYPQTIVLEYLPGKEYTVDCFTDRQKNLLFVGPRERSRISNGISVNTKTVENEDRFTKMAETINQVLDLNGAWFFQVKENKEGSLVLLEVASRMGGSSSTYRAKGINFALLSAFNAFKMPVSILENDFDVELDRALGNVYKFNIEFSHVYVDLDDTLIVDGQVNYKLVGTLYRFMNQGKKIYLITKHKYDLRQTLLKKRLTELFDNIIHLKQEDVKSEFIEHKDAIFIDDSFAERREVLMNAKIPVFGVDINW